MGEGSPAGSVVLGEWAGVDQIPEDLVALAEARAAEVEGRVIGKRTFNVCAMLRFYLPPFAHAQWSHLKRPEVRRKPVVS